MGEKQQSVIGSPSPDLQLIQWDLDMGNRVVAKKMDSVVQHLKVAGDFAFRQAGIKEPSRIKFLTQLCKRR